MARLPLPGGPATASALPGPNPEPRRRWLASWPWNPGAAVGGAAAATRGWRPGALLARWEAAAVAAAPPPESRAQRERLWLDVALVLLLVGLALWVDLPAVLHGGIDWGDEGFEFQLASRLAQGQVPYRDFFTVTTPLAFYWQALLIKTIGPGLLVGRISAALSGAGIATGAYLTGRYLAGRPLAVLAALLTIPWGIPYWAQPNYSWYVDLLALLTAWAALRAGARRGGWALPGLLAALTVLTKQNVGLSTAAAVLVYAAWRGGPRALRTSALFLAAPVAAFLAYLGVAGALPAFWYDTVSFALHSFPTAARIRYPSVHAAAVAAGAASAAGLRALVSYLPQCVLVAGLPILATGAVLRRRWLPEGVLAWMLVLAALTIAYPRSDFVHIDYALPMAFVGLAFVLRRGLATRPVWTPLASLPLLALLAPSWPAHPIAAHQGGIAPDLPYMRGLRLDAGTVSYVRTVTAAVDRLVPPGDPVLILPWNPMLYYLADRPNPTPYDWDITLNMPPAGNARIAQIMAQTRCPVFLQPHDGYSKPFSVYGAPVLAELHRDYRQVGQVAQFQIWVWRTG